MNDLRSPALGLAAWLAALATLHLPGHVVALALLGLAAVVVGRRGGHTPLAWLLVAGAVCAVTGLHLARVDRSGVAPLAADRATVRGTLAVASDPVLREGRFDDYVLFRGTIEQVTGRGRSLRVQASVLVLADPTWRAVPLGARVAYAGRLASSDDADLAAVLTTRGPPQVLSEPPEVLRAVDALRHSIRESAAARDTAGAALVPALVDGDDAGLDDSVDADFRTTGLTHLLAVSGTNLTLIVGFLLVVARWAGVRARGLLVVGALGVVGFVLLARTEPSVVRAAAMGSVALLGMGSNGRQTGVRALGVAVCGLLLLDPWLADSAGFALSVCATAGILLLAPGWRDALLGWFPRLVPRWVAEAVVVPLSAQLACTPVVAAISGQVSLVAVVANMAAAPVVGPATVLGLLGGAVGLGSARAGAVVATPAVWCADWIVAVARVGADLPVAAVSWPTTAAALAALTLLCVALALLLHHVLARRWTSLGSCCAGLLVLLVPLPTPGWPPPGWVFVACDVGQGDALVLNAGRGTAVVVDAGPDPEHVDRCLDRLGVRQVPLLVLTHFHADHVDGLAGVLDGRRVGQITVSNVAEPLQGVRRVRADAAARDIPVAAAEVGERGAVGQVRWQVLAPSGPSLPGSASPANDGSVVLLVDVRGTRLLLLGDQETPAQQRLEALVPDLRVDVVKVAHHGSAKQDPELLDGLGARLAVISCGRDNDYGHPSSEALRMLRRAGLQVARTDRQGDVAVLVDTGGDLRVRTRLPPDRPPPGR